MKKLAILSSFIVFLSVFVVIIWPKAKGVLPVITPSTYPTQPPSAQNSTGIPLVIPNGFKISTFASNLDNPRDLIFDPAGTLLVSVPGQGRVVALPDNNLDHVADKNVTVVFGLNKPHGLAFFKNNLYVAETDKVMKYDYDAKLLKANNPKKILDLPGGGQHGSRSLLIVDNRLYVTVGSTCNACLEADNKRAAVLVSDLNGNNLSIYSSGLRNAPFIIKNPLNSEIWVTEMGRDNLGDDIPPDEINILKQDKNFGWPICYGNNIHDTEFDKNQYIKDPCSDKQPAEIELPAHSAPLGLVFTPSKWPKPFSNQLLVAFHGSWNRSVPTGYKIAVIDPKTHKINDFISGWLVSDKQSVGRPVDLEFDSANNLFISDDKSGKVYLLQELK